MKQEKIRIRASINGCGILDTEITPKKKNLKNIFELLEDKFN